MTAPEGVRVPTGLDDPPRFLLVDAELVVVALTVTYMGAMLDHVATGLLMGALSAYAWHKLSGLHGRGSVQRFSTGISEDSPLGEPLRAP